MKYLCLLLAPFGLGAFAQTTDEWFNAFPGRYSLRNETPVTSISRSQFFEVAASIEAAAESQLATASALPLSAGDLASYGPPSFRCSESTHPYLVRAVYDNGGTGHFQLTTYGTTLFIVHESLGKPTGMRRTALVVCLTSTTAPTAVYHSLGGAL